MQAETRSIRPLGRLARGGLVLCAALGAALGQPAEAATGGDANFGQLLHGLGGPGAAAMPAEAADAHREFVRRLAETQNSVAHCNAFLDRFGASPAVAAILKGIKIQPGHALFTEAQIVDRLEQAVGQPLKVGQLDIERCVQMADQQVGAGSGRQTKLASIEVSLRKCLSGLRADRPDPGVVRILQRLQRGVSDEKFTSRAVLVDLERATGHDTSLTPHDLETCVDAYDVHAAVELAVNPTARYGDISDCNPPSTICQGTDPFDQQCCHEDAVCSATCFGGEGGGECVPVCTPKWCFPGNATVQVEDGTTKAMRDVRIGDRLQVALPDGSSATRRSTSTRTRTAPRRRRTPC